MNVSGVPRRTIAPTSDGAVEIIDQVALPSRFELKQLRTVADMAEAIATMRVRGAPLIGVAAAYGLALGLRDDPSDTGLECSYRTLLETRPTAVNLRWALDTVRSQLAPLALERRAAAAWEAANRLAEDDVAVCRAIGRHGA